MAVKSAGSLGLRRDIAPEVLYTSINVSLGNLSSRAGFSRPDAMSEFYGYQAGLSAGTYLFAQSNQRLDWASSGQGFNFYSPDLTFRGRSDSFYRSVRWWTISDLDNVWNRYWVEPYGGTLSGRFAIKHEIGGTDYRGDVQIDEFNYGGFNEGFDGGTLWERNATRVFNASLTYDGVGALHGWQPIEIGSTAGYWNMDSGTTPSGNTGRVNARGLYCVYMEASSGVDGAAWMRSPRLDFGGEPFEFQLAVDVIQAGFMSIYFIVE